MEKLSGDTIFPSNETIFRSIPIGFIPKYRSTDVSQVHSDLVCTTGLDTTFEETIFIANVRL